MTKVRFFLGDDTEPFIINQPIKTTSQVEQYDKKNIRKKKQMKCFNLLVCFYGCFN